MDTLSIDCTTCGSRLKVRDANLVGQIIACPKCGSMVEVTDPHPADAGHGDAAPADMGQAPPGPANSQRIAVGPEGAVDSQAITQDSLSQAAFSDLSPPGQTSDGSPTDGPVFQSTGIHEPPPPADSPSQAGESNRLDAAAYAQSDRARRTRQIGLITALSTVGLITALVAFGSFVRWWQSAPQAPVVAQQNEPPANDTTSIDAPEISGPADAAPADDAPADAAPADDAPTENAPADDTPADDTPAEPDTADEPMTDPTPPTEASAETDPPAATPDSPPDTDPAPPTAADIAASLMADPILSADDTAGPPAEAGPAADAVAAPTEMPAAMQRWIGVLDFNNATEEPELPAPPTIDQVELDLPSTVQEGEFAAVTDIDVERGLARRMALDRRPAPLIRWLHLLSQISGLPIGVDMVSLDAAGIDPLSSVTPPGGWTTAGEALAALAAQAECQISRLDNLVLVEASPQRVAAAITPALRVDDLLGGDAGQADRPALLALFTRLTPSPSITIGDDSLLQIEGASSAQWLAALTADALRLARGLPTRLPRARTARWLVHGTDCEWPLVTTGPTMAAIDRPLPAIDLLVRIGRANQAYPFIHWADALAHGLSPTTESMPWLKDATAGEALADILDGHQLQTRIAGDGRWWIGSQATYDRSEIVAIAKIDPSQAAAIVSRLATSVGVDEPQLTATVDPQSPYLILRGPRFIVRQLDKIISPR